MNFRGELTRLICTRETGMFATTITLYSLASSPLETAVVTAAVASRLVYRDHKVCVSSTAAAAEASEELSSM